MAGVSPVLSGSGGEMLQIKGIKISGVDKRYGIMMPPGLFGKRWLWVIKKKRSDWYVVACGKSDHFPNILEDPCIKGRNREIILDGEVSGNRISVTWKLSPLASHDPPGFSRSPGI
jgi:hypothetical protein